jgi:hypothetical protein
MTQSPSNEFVAACHEAGHAVGASLLGVPFADVTLDALNAAEGSVPSPLTIDEIRQANLVWQYAIVAMLGWKAEHLPAKSIDR